MKQTLTLGYSTCPNDTFIFYALAHNLIDCGNLSFDIHLADVETLNRKAESGILDISKLSFAALWRLQERYSLLRTGAALGRGCGSSYYCKAGICRDGLPIRLYPYKKNSCSGSVDNRMYAVISLSGADPGKSYSHAV